MTGEPIYVRVTGDGTAVSYALDATGALKDGTVDLRFDGETGIVGVTLAVPGAEGVVSVRELTEPPDGVPSPPGQQLRLFEIGAPDPTNGTATVSLTLSQTFVTRAGTSPDDLIVQHYVDGGRSGDGRRTRDTSGHRIVDR